MLRKVDADYEEISDDDLDEIIGTDDVVEQSVEESKQAKVPGGILVFSNVEVML